jgi:hypothetical protein
MADSKDLKDFGKELGVANDKLESFASSIKKLIREEVDGFKRVNDQLSIGKDLVAELAKSYDGIKDIIGDIDLSRTISQESDLLNKLKKKEDLEKNISDLLSDRLTDYLTQKKQLLDLEELSASATQEHADYYQQEIADLRIPVRYFERKLKALLEEHDVMLRQNRALEEQKRALEDIRITIENTFGFNQFKGLFGILAKLPNLENAFKNMSLSTMMFLGLATMYLKAVFGTLYKAFDDVNGAFVKTAKSFYIIFDSDLLSQ